MSPSITRNKLALQKSSRTFLWHVTNSPTLTPGRWRSYQVTLVHSHTELGRERAAGWGRAGPGFPGGHPQSLPSSHRRGHCFVILGLKKKIPNSTISREENWGTKELSFPMLGQEEWDYQQNNEGYGWSMAEIPGSKRRQPLQHTEKSIHWVSPPRILQAREWVMWPAKITFPVLRRWGFPLKTTDYRSYSALLYFPEEKAHAKEVYTKGGEQMYSVCQYSIAHNELLNGKSKKQNIKLHIKKIEKL